ncbi:MAG: hypothetical protein ACJAT2_002468 [Bacteriovoracaceae bacterium]|jgi:hypothetical protein
MEAIIDFIQSFFTKKASPCLNLKQISKLENRVDSPNNHTRKALYDDDCLSQL